jgi:Uma2 family endonuclease
MTALPEAKMTVDEFLAWAEGRPGRYELVDGEVFAIRPSARGTRERSSPSRTRSCRRSDAPVYRARRFPTE